MGGREACPHVARRRRSRTRPGPPPPRLGLALGLGLGLGLVRVGPGYRVRVRVRANPNPNHLGDELRSARCPCRAAGARARHRRHEPRPQQDAEPVRAERAERACGEGVRRLDRICVCGGPRPLPLLSSPLLLLKSQCAVGARSSPAAWSGGIDRVRIFRAVGAVPTDPSTTHSTDERRG